MGKLYWSVSSERRESNVVRFTVKHSSSTLMRVMTNDGEWKSEAVSGVANTNYSQA